MCVVGWNSGMRCVNHAAQSARFVTLVGPTMEINAGLASGQVLSGNVSGKRRRHVTVAGACVELSILLAESAAQRCLRFLAAGAVGSHLEREELAVKLETWPQVKREGTAAKLIQSDLQVWGPEVGIQEATSVRLQQDPEGGFGLVVPRFVASFPEGLSSPP
eukprot:Hpha_TRINITY_DN15863_c0_g1::TRINITY_DN15863_c0_g1_i2::g.186909::m.186909